MESCVDMQANDVSKYFDELYALGNSFDKDKTFQEILAFCKAIGNEERLKLLLVLKDEDKCVCELEAILNKAQSTISHHLRKLEDVGLIMGFKKGKFTHYDIIDKKLLYFLDLMNKELKSTP
ncbi:MAG: ArsR family transcriptional regulator [Promethearchaeota archaeon]|nr:MAG: ArsR family transcriptional regulator [Candidatus Lokiarchaeota archaeon]